MARSDIPAHMRPKPVKYDWKPGIHWKTADNMRRAVMKGLALVSDALGFYHDTNAVPHIPYPDIEWSYITYDNGCTEIKIEATILLYTGEGKGDFSASRIDWKILDEEKILEDESLEKAALESARVNN